MNKKIEILIFMAMLSFGLVNIKQNNHEIGYATPAINDEQSIMTNNQEMQASKQFNNMNVGDCLDKYDGEGVTVAIIDSGINYQHEEFFDENGNSIISLDSAAFTSSSRYSITSNIFSNVTYVSRSGLSILDDTIGHGTNVAGLIAAQINDKGMRGIAPKVNLLILKTDYTSVALETALYYAANMGADIINMSIQAYLNDVTYNGSTMQGNYIWKNALTNGIKYAYENGSTIVAAAGNYNTSESCYPASYDHVIGVGSLADNSTTQKAGFSNYGDYVDLVAPGYVYTTAIGSDSKYINTQGTSFSAPLVAGLLALIKQKYPELNNNDLEKFLYSNLDKMDNSDKYFGNGRTNVSKSLADILISQLTISPSSLTLHCGDMDELSVTIEPSNASNQLLEWTSSDDEICIVDDEGTILAYHYGTAIITVKTKDGSDVFAQMEVEVIPYEDDYIEIINPKTEFFVGEKFTLDQAKVIWHYHINGEDIEQVEEISNDNAAIKYTLNDDLTSVGTKIVTINYYGLTTSYEIHVIAKENVNITNVINKIDDLKNSFQEKRSKSNDLSNIKTKYDEALSSYNSLEREEQSQITNYNTLNNCFLAYEFLVKFYQNVRVDKDGVLSICDFVDSPDLISFINEYDQLTREVKEILKSAYDTTSLDNKVITIGQTMDYLAHNAKLTNISENEATVVDIMHTKPTLVIVISICFSGLILLSLIVIIIYLYLKKTRTMNL